MAEPLFLRPRTLREILAGPVNIDDPYEVAAEHLGHDFLEALPYSCIPSYYDGARVLEFLVERGWTPPAEEATP